MCFLNFDTHIFDRVTAHADLDLVLLSVNDFTDLN